MSPRLSAKCLHSIHLFDRCGIFRLEIIITDFNCIVFLVSSVAVGVLLITDLLYSSSPISLLLFFSGISGLVLGFSYFLCVLLYFLGDLSVNTLPSLLLNILVLLAYF